MSLTSSPLDPSPPDSDTLASSHSPRYHSAPPPRKPPPPVGLAPPSRAIQPHMFLHHQLDARHEPTAMNLSERAFPLMEIRSRSALSQNPSLNTSFHIWGVGEEKWGRWTRRPLKFPVPCFQVGGGRCGSLS